MPVDKAFILSQRPFNFLTFFSRWIQAFTARFPGRQNYRPLAEPESTPEHPISVVCISDTHNWQPELPDGDILLHAGDLTVNGTFEELQAQLTWLSAQPHTYKILVAGEHDVLLDPPFAQRNPDSPSRIGAFHVPRGTDVWTRAVPEGTDVLLTHEPPSKHLDGDLHSGCAFLGQEIERVKPRLVVFGHVHDGYGVKTTNFDEKVVPVVEEGTDRQRKGWGPFFRAVREQTGHLFEYIFPAAPSLMPTVEKQKLPTTTTFVNACLIGDLLDGNDNINEPIVTHI
ncbi:metallophosphoesterase domain-containing protein 1 [Microsporum canis CBS 113480]|uniref:Metallophosphoesterase domain-containing protein 1 n=1 Tax=Arthroderma otae (strain ATCC MYA-4605 / CBS 113480) TaxID=554155 RepID=C5FEH9_ARTOC|nr:metallophosphoesterase domain-containing protein 1 [Microsporum canis CBS 113480]EEQ28213.1 metallophosphoesterase domain-containing protein 1 [Microsporum canis CBS 113480]